MKLTSREIAHKVSIGQLDNDTVWVIDNPKLYYLKLDVELDFTTHGYLNYDKVDGTFLISDNTSVDSFKVMFSEKDIDELGIQMGYFTKEEVSLCI